MSVRHFSSPRAYLKWLAFGHIHGSFKRVPGNQLIVIHGRRHNVRH